MKGNADSFFTFLMIAVVPVFSAMPEAAGTSGGNMLPKGKNPNIGVDNK